MKFRVWSADSARRFGASNPSRAQPLPARRRPCRARAATTRVVTARDRRRRRSDPAASSDERVEHLLVEARGVAQRGVPALDRARRAGRAAPDPRATWRSRCARPNATWRASSCAASRATSRVHRIGRVIAQEPQQREEAALAEHREQERREREVGLVEQRLERRLAAGGRQAERVAPEHARGA